MFNLRQFAREASQGLLGRRPPEGTRWASNGVDFERRYVCYPGSFGNREDIEKGNKILLPPSALEHLAQLNVTWPMMFSLSNPTNQRLSHCGVLEFTSEEGVCYLPYWLMKNLELDEGAQVVVRNTSLLKGTYVKLQPVTKDFLDVHDPRVVLEQSLRYFAALTVNDTIAITYNDRTYEIAIVDLKPTSAVSVIETDIEVDFAPPKDWVEPEPQPQPQPPPPLASASAPPSVPLSTTSTSSGFRLDGRSPAMVADEPKQINSWTLAIPHGVKMCCPKYDELIQRGSMRAVKNFRYMDVVSNDPPKPVRTNFGGQGTRLDTR